MRCIAIDDEPIALSVIEQFCSRISGLTLTTFNDPLQGIEAVISSKPEILFLDIEMGSENGVELARRVPEGVKIIFTTAYAQFALDGFEIGVVDFLHKPFPFSRFERAVQRAQQLTSHTIDDDLGGTITVSIEYRSVTIETDEIIYIEAMDNYVKIHLGGSRPLLPQMNLKAIEELLASDRFIRIHKSYIVSRRWIEGYNRSQVVLKNERQLPIGRSYLSGFLGWV
ncbi:MAG: LytTR family DNA-binding domain-containing protein [Rikenellaceae bacterium]